MKANDYLRQQTSKSASRKSKKSSNKGTLVSSHESKKQKPKAGNRDQLTSVNDCHKSSEFVSIIIDQSDIHVPSILNEEVDQKKTSVKQTSLVASPTQPEMIYVASLQSTNKSLEKLLKSNYDD